MEPSAIYCVLDIQSSQSGNNSSCESGNWDGFLDNDCCGSAFNGYLHALGQRANETGEIFLNSTEQKVCLNSMKSNNGYILSCGIEKLTSGAGSCSDYSIKDVTNKLGYQLRSLDEDCKVLGSDGKSSEGWTACSRGWEKIGGPSNTTNDAMKVESDVCRFAVLVSLTSKRIYDEEWLQAIYKCLGDNSLPLSGHTCTFSCLISFFLSISVLAVTNHPISSAEDHGESKPVKKIGTGLWILIGGLAGVIIIIIFASWILFKRSTKAKLEEGKDASDDSFSEESSCQKIGIKQVYSATNNLSATNYIGQGIAGKDKNLSWIQRLEIAIDCARGLWFLHTYPEGCIVHRDIKPTNILISANFQGKLSDFGLSKVMDMGQSYVSSEVRGTFGYVDPEYQKNRRVNSSGDVYSFGVVLLQLISGQRVINMDLTKPMPLGKMAKMLTRGGNIAEFADPKLGGVYSVEAFELTLKLALSCTGLKQQRPSMEQVVVRLDKALDISTRVEMHTPRFALNVD
ncbi:hypothetical protein RJ640_016161 [Escallonia rubra]|uniref:Protein kinase domain-containing protein n=1 Tax=Escallonia rubra TaxID=112253 RepID=A0AA88RJ69_9ASTE|nr:hypothetical protein RJ640_016161 [Escallonia rubra]